MDWPVLGYSQRSWPRCEIRPRHRVMQPRPRRLFTASISTSWPCLVFYACWVEFPWKELGYGATICDVGGGIGNISLQLARAYYPNLRLILQDLTERIQQAKNEVWPKEYPEAISERRITFESIDFFAASPVPSCIMFVKSNFHF